MVHRAGRVRSILVRLPAIGLPIAWALVSLPARCLADDIALPSLRSEVITRAGVDQFLRREIDLAADEDKPEWQRIRIVDHANTARMKDVIAKRGWLTSAKVGQDGAAAAWLLVQHADDDPAFQQRCLKLIEALPQDEVPGESRALLTDRVLLARGAKQRFGSQFEGDCTNGFTIRPLEDPERVDQRRAAYGLPSLAAYLAFAKTIFCPIKTEQ